jgi:predicted amidohydrolase
MFRMLLVWCSLLPVLCAGDWTLWSPRSEIAPVSRIDSVTGDLLLEGGGNPAVFGGWVRDYPGVTGDEWYRLKVRYQAQGLTTESLQLLVRLDWQNAQGKRAGQPDYAFEHTREGGWNVLTLTAPAPPKSSAVKAQLLLLNAPKAKVRWSGVTFEPVAAPAARPVRVATVRLRPRNEEDPVAKFIEVVERKLTGPADIILLPEGITVVGTTKSYADVAEPLPGPTTERLGELARARKAWIVAGVMERDGSAVYNTAVLIDREGRLAGKYRKIYIPREETEGGVTAGSDFPVFDTDFGRIGMMICWDVQYPEPARGLALRGAELVLMPIWGGHQTLAQARAIENHIYLATSGYDFPSMLYDPSGETLVRSEEDGTVAVATIDLSRRKVDPWLGEMRGRLYRETRRDLAVLPPQ